MVMLLVLIGIVLYLLQELFALYNYFSFAVAELGQSASQ
jgi:hypothetical protein